MQCKWQSPPEKECGVLAGCDRAQEWLLEWWWERYSAENAFPVTFVDFGMSEQMHRWCAQRGDMAVIDLDMSFIASRSRTEEKSNPRTAWFKKPFALLHSPYKKSIWLDVDCEVLGPIDALFSQCQGACELAMAREYRCEHLPHLHPDIVYNGGVIVFCHGSAIIQKWAEETIVRNQDFVGDDFLLSALIYEQGLNVEELPEIYNWRIVNGVNLNAVIVHWVWKKNVIKTYGGLKPLLKDFYKQLSGSGK